MIYCAIAVSVEKIAIVVNCGQEEIIDTDHVKTVSHSHIIERNHSVLKVKIYFLPCLIDEFSVKNYPNTQILKSGQKIILSLHSEVIEIFIIN